MKAKVNRREFIGRAGAATIGVVTGLPAIAGAMASCRPVDKRKRALRIAHLTDIHIQPEGAAPEGMAHALRSAQGLADKPDIIFTGGDSIMDALKADKAQTKAQWEIFRAVLKNECSLPVVHCIGNHDVWGWGLENESVKGDRLYGKQWAIEEMGLESRYYSFDKAGWRFIVLDSTHEADKQTQSSEPYIAKLDEEQFEWLKKKLEETPGGTPICVLSHIPIICFCAFFDGENEKSGDWQVPGAWMHIDARRIKDLFREYKNVRVCLSGHMHMEDKVEFLGVKYLCNGAVCGSWWEGDHYEFPPAYVVVNLYNDGTAESEYVPYKWQQPALMEKGEFH